MATSIFRKNFPGTAALQAAADAADYIIGLDLHQKTTAICVLDRRAPERPVFQRKRLPNGELLATIGRFAGRKVIACEAAYGWHLLRTALGGMPEVTFIPLDARRTAGWMRSSGVKNDRIDAQVLCAALLHGGVAGLAVYAPSAPSRRCGLLVLQRDAFVRQRTGVTHRLAAFAREYGPNPYTGEIPPSTDLLRTLEENLGATLRFLDERIAACDRLIAAESRGDAVVARLRTIPGIGPVTAFALRWKIDDIDRFESSRHLCGYLGLGVRERASGERAATGKITKTGNALLRKLLVQGAQVVRFRKPDLLPLYFPSFAAGERMQDRIHANKVVVALARKHLTFAYHLWKKECSFDLDRYRSIRAHASSPGDVAVPGVSGAPTLALPSPCVPSKRG